MATPVVDSRARVVRDLAVDERLAEAPDGGTTPFILVSSDVSLLLCVAVPALRRNRSTPGASKVMLVPVRLDDRPARFAALLVCWTLR